MSRARRHTCPQTRAQELLYRFRDYRRLSQSALALRLCTYQDVISELERGVRHPGLQLAIRIEAITGGMVPCTAWGVPADDDK